MSLAGYLAIHSCEILISDIILATIVSLIVARESPTTCFLRLSPVPLSVFTLALTARAPVLNLVKNTGCIAVKNLKGYCHFPSKPFAYFK